MDTYQQAVLKALRSIIEILAGIFAYLIFGIVWLVWSAWPAHAQMYNQPQTNLHLPPVEYDRPYEGDLTVETVNNAQLRARCASASQWSLGCAFPGVNSCRILLVNEEAMKAGGWPRDLMYRHERAHCNGWPQSHVGKRPYP